MSSENRLAVLSFDQRNRVEAMLMQFEEAWRPGLLEQFAQKVDAEEELSQVALAELVKIDLQRGWAVQQGRTLEEYCRRFPELGTPEKIDPEFILIEFEARRAANPELDLGSYECRFPNQFERLSELHGHPLQSDKEGATPGEQASIQTSQVNRIRATSEDRKQVTSNLPREFGRYQIVRELGSGAMGAVYLAHDTQLNRQVAIKTPSFDGVKDEELIARFQREARAAAKLQHRNICPIYDVGEIDGRQFISMAFIKGRCLSEFIGSNKRPPVKTAAILILRLANALAEAHHHNVVHRDLKPANIMVDLKKEPIVMDFGLARETDVETRVTQSGMMVGTPAYMSPEQVSGDPQDVGPQADIYALGVILYELLTGQLPFYGSIARVVYQITSAEPTPPSKIRPEVDPEIEAICSWMMAKDRLKRFQSMDEVASALRKYLKTPNVNTDAEVSQKYHRTSLVNSTPPEFKPAEDSGDSDKVSTYALREYFGSEEVADPRQTAVEAVPESLKPLRRMTVGSRGGDGGKNLLLAGGLAGGFLLLLLGIIIYFKGGKVELDANAKTSVDVREDGSVLITPEAPKVSSNDDNTNNHQKNSLSVTRPVSPSLGSSTKDSVVLPITELNIGGYNASPWPSQDGLRLYWESQQTSAGASRTVTRMASRPDSNSKFGLSKIIAEGRMATFSPDELEIVCVPNDGRKSLLYANRESIHQTFQNFRALSLTNEPETPKSPCFSSGGLQLIVQSSQPGNNEFLLSTRRDAGSGWSPFRQFGRMGERYHGKPLTWPFVSGDGLRIWYGSGGDRGTQIWTGTRTSLTEAFGEFEAVKVNDKPLIGRAPRYVDATHELFFSRPVGEDGWELAVLKDYSPAGGSVPEYVSLFNGTDLSGWKVIGHDGWRVENGTIVGRASEQQKGWLMSDASFGDFELRLQYLLTPDSNSGIFLRAWPEGAVRGADFHEIQLLDDTSIQHRKLTPKQRTGSLYNQIAADPVLRPVPNIWHDVTIRLQGRSLQVSIDGQKVTDGLIPQNKQARGHIGLQLYPNEVQFWNIRIKDLDQDSAPRTPRSI